MTQTLCLLVRTKNSTLNLREILPEEMNNQLGEGTFVVPDPYIPKVAARVMDLLEPTNKMSKSAVNPAGCIFFQIRLSRSKRNSNEP